MAAFQHVQTHRHPSTTVPEAVCIWKVESGPNVKAGYFLIRRSRGRGAWGGRAPSFEVDAELYYL